MDMPNAFAAGHSRKTATVCVTTGLMERLEPRELEGVLAHELSHIANRDVVVMTVAGFLATVAGLLVRFGVYSGMMGGRSRDNTAVVFLVVVVASVARLRARRSCCCGRSRATASTPPTAARPSSPARRPSSRRRSQKISGTMARIPTRDLRAAEGMNAFFIMPAVSKGFSLSSIVSTHPPDGEADRAPAGDAGAASTPPPRSRERGPHRQPTGSSWACSTSCGASARPSAPTSTPSSRSARRP